MSVLKMTFCTRAKLRICNDSTSAIRLRCSLGSWIGTAPKRQIIHVSTPRFNGMLFSVFHLNCAKISNIATTAIRKPDSAHAMLACNPFLRGHGSQTIASDDISCRNWSKSGSNRYILHESTAGNFIASGTMACKRLQCRQSRAD